MDELLPPDPEKKHETKIGEGTLFSLRVVSLILIIAIWLVRLDDQVKAQRKDIEDIRRKLESEFRNARLQDTLRERDHHSPESQPNRVDGENDPEQ